MSQDRNHNEARIRAAFEAQSYERAATLAIAHYGAEVFGFLRSQLRDEEAAMEVFAQFSEVFWQTLPEFRWACSMRTWAYKLARSEAQRYRRRERKHNPPRVSDTASPLSKVAYCHRTTTAAYQRTAIKDRFQRLRETLRPDDQALLVLRVDRGLSWRELAEVMFEGAAAERDREVEAARLRKRFQVLRTRLRRLARDSGLLER